MAFDPALLSPVEQPKQSGFDPSLLTPVEDHGSIGPAPAPGLGQRLMNYLGSQPPQSPLYNIGQSLSQVPGVVQGLASVPSSIQNMGPSPTKAVLEQLTLPNIALAAVGGPGVKAAMASPLGRKILAGTLAGFGAQGVQGLEQGVQQAKTDPAQSYGEAGYRTMQGVMNALPALGVTAGSSLVPGTPYSMRNQQAIAPRVLHPGEEGYLDSINAQLQGSKATDTTIPSANFSRPVQEVPQQNKPTATSIPDTQPANMPLGQGFQTLAGTHVTMDAQRVANANPGKTIVKGYVTADGQFLGNNPLAAVRALAQQKEQANANQSSVSTGSSGQAQPIVEEVGQEKGQGSVGQEPVPSAPQGEVPGNVGQGLRQPGGSNVQSQRDAGGLTVNEQSQLKNLLAIPEVNRNEWQSGQIGKLQGKQGGIKPKMGGQTGEAGFFRLFGGADLSRLGIKQDAKVQGEQMYNRMKNVLGAGSAAWDLMDKAGLRAFLQTPHTVKEVEEWLGSVAPKVGLHSYGMEGKVSEAKNRYDQAVGELDKLGYRLDSAGRLTRQGSDFSWEDNNPNITPEIRKWVQQGRDNAAQAKADARVKATSYYKQVSAVLAEKNARDAEHDNQTINWLAKQPQHIRDEVEARLEKAAGGARMEDVLKQHKQDTYAKGSERENEVTSNNPEHYVERNYDGSYYVNQNPHVGISDTRIPGKRYATKEEAIQAARKLHGLLSESDNLAINKYVDATLKQGESGAMPWWTRSAIEARKGGQEAPTNVQRVDVVVPQKKMSMEDYGKLTYEQQKELGNIKPEGGQAVETLWQHDKIHENLPNTLGWAMIQYKTGPKGEKIAVIVEAQSRWAQVLRDQKSDLERIQRETEAETGRRMTDTEMATEYRIAQNHPLLKDYNRLIHKAAIEQAKKEGATHIMVSDYPTAAHTEGWDTQYKGPYTTLEDAEQAASMMRGSTGDNWIVEKPEQTGRKNEWLISPHAGGGRLNYDTVLPKIVEELTGSKGEKVSVGEHKNAMHSVGNSRRFNTEAEARAFASDPNNQTVGNVYEQTNPHGWSVLTKAKPRSNLIFKNPDGTPKTDVSGRMYPIGKVDTQNFSLMEKDKAKSPVQTLDKTSGKMTSQSGSIINPATAIKELGEKIGSHLKPFIEDLDRTRVQLMNQIRTAGPKANIIAWKDAADNKAKIVARQASNGLKAQVKSIFGPQTEQALGGLTAAIEAQGDRAILDKFIEQAKTDPRGKANAQFAKDNWERLQTLVQRVSDVHDKELLDEQQAGLDVQKRSGYIRHAYDASKIPDSLIDQFLGSSGGEGQRGFLKQRKFDTLYDAIEAGYGKAIKSWNAADLIENRLSKGQQMVNDVKWLDGLNFIDDPSTGKPIAARLEKKVNPYSGDVDANPPAGYEKWSPFPGRTFAVHRGYKNLFQSITDISHIRRMEAMGLPVGQWAMEGIGGLKHSMLLFDSYHAMRMTAKGLSMGIRGYGKGLSLLEYGDKDLDNALKNNDIDKESYDYAKENRGTANKLINSGLNVGRIQEGLDSEIYTSLLPKLGTAVSGKVGGKIMGAPGTFNTWVFQKMTRGIMLEAGVKEHDRLVEQGVSDSDATKQAVKFVNTYFGNLGRQGVFRSKTAQDISKIILLAPQWVESMARTEAGTVGQSLKYGVQKLAQPVTGKEPILGGLAKSTGAMLLATVAATQVVNMLTRGKPTWENPEEDHKLDAWIPVGKEGFWVTPYGLPMELTHDLIRYNEQGKSPLDIGRQMLSNKESPLARAAQVGVTGRDYTGQKLSDPSTLKNIGKNLLPLPLPVQALTGGRSGQLQRQLMASAGVKAEPASAPSTIVNNLRRQFLYSHGKLGQPSSTPNEHRPLIQALQDNDMATAQQEYDKLLPILVKKNFDAEDPEEKSKKDLQTFFRAYANSHEQTSQNQEEDFFHKLTPHQQDLYKKVKEQQQEVSERFKTIQPDEGKGFPIKKIRGINKYNKGDSVSRGGQQYTVVGFDTDGQPLVEPA